jgi:hypothetical protein
MEALKTPPCCVPQLFPFYKKKSRRHSERDLRSHAFVIQAAGDIKEAATRVLKLVAPLSRSLNRAASPKAHPAAAAAEGGGEGDAAVDEAAMWAHAEPRQLFAHFTAALQACPGIANSVQVRQRPPPPPIFFVLQAPVEFKSVRAGRRATEKEGELQLVRWPSVSLSLSFSASSLSLAHSGFFARLPSRSLFRSSGGGRFAFAQVMESASALTDPTAARATAAAALANLKAADDAKIAAAAKAAAEAAGDVGDAGARLGAPPEAAAAAAAAAAATAGLQAMGSSLVKSAMRSVAPKPTTLLAAVQISWGELIDRLMR